MSKIFSFVMGLLVIISFSGCGDSVSMVKKGTLDFDKSITIGQAFDKYKYFKKIEWKEFVTDNGRKVVQVEGIVDKNDMVYVPKNTYKEIKVVAQFAINLDNTFKFSYFGIYRTQVDGEIIEDSLNDFLIMGKMEGIFANKPIF